MKIQPNKLVICAKPDEAKKQTDSGLLLADYAVEQPKTATVISVGEGLNTDYIGKKILYKPYSAHDIQIDKERFILIAAEDVLGTVED